jgi:DNA-directed RNA polymerase subunit RPC12/RpoP
MRRYKTPKDPIVSNVQPETVQAPKLKAPKRERSVAAVEAERRYREKKSLEKKIAKESAAANPVPGWEAIHKVISETLYWVTNIEDGLCNNLVPGVGCDDACFNADGTCVDINQPTMSYPEEVLQDVRAMVKKYGTIDRSKPNYDDDAWRAWRQGYLVKVPLETEFRVIKVIEALERRKQIAQLQPALITVKCSTCTATTELDVKTVAAYKNDEAEYKCATCLARIAAAESPNFSLPEPVTLDSWGRPRDNEPFLGPDGKLI